MHETSIRAAASPIVDPARIAYVDRDEHGRLLRSIHHLLQTVTIELVLLTPTIDMWIDARSAPLPGHDLPANELAGDLLRHSAYNRSVVRGPALLTGAAGPAGDPLPLGGDDELFIAHALGSSIRKSAPVVALRSLPRPRNGAATC